MRDILSLLGYVLIAFFGIFLSAGFSGLELRRKTLPGLLLFTAASLAVQAACLYFGDIRLVQWLYPLIVHFPLVLVLALGFKIAWPTAVVSVFLAYLCCQIPRCIASIAYLFAEDPLYFHIFYIPVVCAAYAVLHRYAVQPVQKIMVHTPLAVWGLGLLPLLYYVFDYLTTIYTDLLYSGNLHVAQIMPSALAIGYILFVLVYQSRVEEREAAQQERQLLSIQLRRSQAEYSALCQMQDQANRFHHDLRHHTTLLLEYAEKGSLTEIKAYLRDIQQNLDIATFKHFCGHQVVNLVLSHFDSEANKAGVRLTINAELPQTLPFKDTELCSLLSNGLENAIYAAAQVENETERIVTVSLSIRQRNLLLSIQNPYRGEVTIADGIPVTNQPGHGLGTRSMASIVNQYGGLLHFSAKNSTFLLRASLPMQ